MKSDEWQKIKEIFNATIDLSEGERAKILETHDENLRREVEKLIEANNEAEGFIVEPALVDIGLVEEDEAGFYIGKQIDSYKILKEIGEGGMGTVYLATRADESFDKKVAIKLIKRGMDTSSVLKRFVMERQILARLEHPNISLLLDGGTTEDGLPYFVMEYVEGLPITKFCDFHQFSIEERLKIFQSVCSAVTYAHQNLVVHRDLKPSNIIVTAEGSAKLLDFGIAKLLNPDWSVNTAEATATMFRAMTPEYASPEQLRGLPITTASDVYSLGIVLYELLTGKRPFTFESHQPEEVAKIVLTEDPIKPSDVTSFESKDQTPTSEANTLSYNGRETSEIEQNPKSRIQNPKSLKGDLDNIILKAIRREPERRYQSIQEFSEDIRRHLVGLPVTATADTASYRLNKFVKRHRVGVFAGLLVFLTLLSATSITSWQAVVAKRERDKADQRFNQVRKLANTVLFDYQERIKNLPGATETRKKMVMDALEYLDNLAQNSDNSIELQRELALAYQKVGDIQGGISDSANTGETDAALENYRKSIAIQEKLVSQLPSSDGDRQTLAKLYINVGEQIAKQGDLSGRENYCRKALAIMNELAQTDTSNTTARSDLANVLRSLAIAVVAKGDYDEGIANYRQTAAIYEHLAFVEPEADIRGTRFRNAALTYKSMGAVFEMKQDSSSALELYRKALAIDIKNADANPNNVQYSLDKSFSYNSIASALTNLGNFHEALENCQKAFAIQEKVVADDAKNAFAQNALARTYRRKGDILQKLEKFDDAATDYKQSIRMFEELSNKEPNNIILTARLGEIYSLYGNFLLNLSSKSATNKKANLQEAQTFQKRSLEIFQTLKSQNKLDKFYEEQFSEVQKDLQQTEKELAKLSAK